MYKRTPRHGEKNEIKGRQFAAFFGIRQIPPPIMMMMPNIHKPPDLLAMLLIKSYFYINPYWLR